MVAQQGQSQGDQTSSFFWYVVLLALAFLVVWFCFKKYLVPPLFYLRIVEVHVLEYVLTAWNWIASLVHLPLANLTALDKALTLMQTADPSKITIDQVEEISKMTGKFYRYPFILIILGLAYFCFFHHRSARFITHYSMKTLKNAEAEHWPQIIPVVEEDILKMKLNEGPWAMSKLPMDFCKEHNLLRLVTKNEKKCWSINQGAAERQFVMQMGSLWEGVDALPIHIKALVVVFLQRTNRDRKTSTALLNQIAKSAQNTGRLDFTGIEEALQQVKTHKALVWAAKQHAYVYTIMATLLGFARSEGVLATAEFIWLKPLDRRLWYVLNAVGRATPVVEVAGVYAHWQAEKKIGRAMSTPVIGEAVVALESAVGDILYVAEGERWHTSNAA